MDIEIEDDDAPKGKVLSRREVLALFAGLGGAALLVACDPGSNTSTAQPTNTSSTLNRGTAGGTAMGTGTLTPGNAEAATAVAASPAEASPTADTAAIPDCVVRPELTEGPYFVDEKLNRSDIRTDPTSGEASQGVPLALAFMVSQVGAGACTPLKDTQIDVWHCDAEGTYSDVQGSSGTKFLRGYQTTGADGKVQFTSIYPGWYRGRAVHIHFKIRTTGTAGQSYEFTSQIFFDDAINSEVYKQAPYSQRGQPDMLNASDGIYRGGGNQLLLSPKKSGDGYTATLPIGLDLSDTQAGQSDSAQGGGGPAPGGPGGAP